MAGVITATDQCCLNLQVALDGISGENTPDAIRESFGMIDALRSGTNTAGFEAVPTATAFPGKRPPQTGGGAGNRPTVEIKYIKPTRRTVATARTGLCATQTDLGDPYEYLTVPVTNDRALGGQFTKQDFDELCETPSERLAISVRQTALDLMRSINSQLITQAYALVGDYADGTSSSGATSKGVVLLNPDGHVNPAAMAAVKSQYRRQHTETNPIMVGGDMLGIWRDTRVMAGMGSNAIGAASNPLGVTGGVETYVDFQVDPIVQGINTDTLNHAISWIPGAFQMLEWYEFVGYKEEIGKQDYTQTTITIDGMTFDWALRYDECNSRWNFELAKQFDLFAIPDASYTQGGANVWPFNRRLAFNLEIAAFTADDYLL